MLPVLLLLLIMLISLTCCYGVECQKSQAEALLQFQQAAGSDTSFWPNNTDCCSWNGVVCNSNGLVVSLTLSYDAVDGPFYKRGAPWPAYLAKLKSLQVLHFENIYFMSPLPPEIGFLSQSLTNLTLLACGLEAPIPGEALSNISQLTHLDLSQQVFGLDPAIELFGFFNGTIPWQLCNLTRLAYLDLSDNSLGGSIPSCLGSLPRLSYLDLNQNTLGSGIPSSLGSLPRLSVLDLSVNALNGSIPDQWLASSPLSSLHLEFNMLSGHIPEQIGENLLDLRFLDLQSNNLTGSIPGSLGQLTQLQELMLNSNDLIGEIPAALGNLTRLNKLDLRDNRLVGKIPRELGNLLLLEELYLSGNRLSGRIPVSLGRLSNLKNLNLGNNFLSGSVPSSLGNLHGAEVDLSINNLTGDFPMSLLCLYSLDLSFNHLTSMAGKHDSDSTCTTNNNNTMLGELSIHSNNIIGIIPSWISSLHGLTRLDLSMNVINGEVPLHSLLALPNLWFINVSYNQLNSLSNLQSVRYSASHILEELYLHSNNLSGIIPWEVLQNFSALDTLDLSGNQFSGGISKGIGKLGGSLNTLDLSQNFFRGEIPSSIGNLTKLQILQLSHNYFVGMIPASLGRACLISNWGLIKIKLDNNLLTGPIPAEVGHCWSLTSLVLRDNKLTGLIPNTLKNLSELVVMDLAHNSLRGRLLPWIYDLPFLRVLSLGFNKLAGPLPSWNSSRLQVLDLSYNNLNGSIPVEGIKLLQAFRNSSSGIVTNDSQDLNSSIPGVRFDLSNYQISSSTTYTLYDEVVIVQAKDLELPFTYLLQSMVSFDVSGNELVGPIPSELGLLEALVFLNISNNQLDGPIPWSLGDLKQLQSLDISGNELVGEIPETLCALNFLEVVNVSNNKLGGPIPRCNQWTTFINETAFMGNKDLCGPPLAVPCTGKNQTAQVVEDEGSAEEEEEEGPTFLVAFFVGFSIGFPLCLSIIWLWKPISDPLFTISAMIIARAFSVNQANS